MFLDRCPPSRIRIEHDIAATVTVLAAWGKVKRRPLGWFRQTPFHLRQERSDFSIRYILFGIWDKIQEPSSAKCSVELAEPFRTDEKATFPSLVFGARLVKKSGIWRHLKTMWVPCHGSGALSPSCHRKEPSSVPGQCFWALWCTKWELDRFSSEPFDFPLSVLLQRCSVFILSSITAIM